MRHVRFLTPVLVLGLVLGLVPSSLHSTAHASAPLLIVSELAWAGSIDSSSDEWVELANPGSSPVDLTGWSIHDGSTTYTLSGTVPAHGFFLVERAESATSIAADLVIPSLSFSNTGEPIALKNAGGTTIDDVNPAGSAWPAGSTTTKATMERISPEFAASDPSAWASSTADGPATASLGTTIRGTPRAANSVAAPSGERVTLDAPETPVLPGSVVLITLRVHDAPELFSYGLDVTYPAASVSSVTATEGAFLAGSPAASTTFQSGLVDGVAGTLRLAGSRLTTPPSTVSGSGVLSTLSFTLAPTASGSLDIGIAPSAFLSDATADIPGVTFSGATITVGAAVDPVEALVVAPGTARYSLVLTWDAPAGGAESYRIRRVQPDGSLAILGTVTTTSFTDDDTVSAGGAIVPTRSYAYEVTALRGSDVSTPVNASGVDPRGLLGDSTRDDTTNGRDLTGLARSWGLATGDADFARLSDTSVDGSVDGDDLVDLARNWARTYTVTP